MTLLRSKFNFHGHDPHGAAKSSLMTDLWVKGATGPYGGPGGSGTPIAGPIFRGAIVNMDTAVPDGRAVLADYDLHAALPAKIMYFVAVDGDQDFDGAFVHKVSCLQGGAEFLTDQFTANPGLVPGAPLRPGATSTGDVGKFHIAAFATDQIYGYVGDEGYNASTGLLHVIIPQGV
jgi:hypothetical protein